MSRIGKLPIAIKSWVTVTLNDNVVTVKWPKGELSYTLPNGVVLAIENNEINTSVVSDEFRNLWGLVRTLVNNMVEWVTEGYSKKLLVFWVWYNVKLNGNKLVFNLWFSHPVDFELPKGISAATEKDPKWSDIITISWIDKQMVGETAAKIRSMKVPEVYKWKWIRYVWETIKLKAWKTAKK